MITITESMRKQQWLCVLCFVFHAGLATGTCPENEYTAQTVIQAQWPSVSFASHENEFASGGSLDNYAFSLWNGVSAKLISGWTHTASYAHGFLRSGAGDSLLEVNGLVPGKEYLYATYNFHDPTHSTYAYSWGLNSFTLYVNGVQVASLSGQPTSSEPTYTGQVAADSSGKILFKFTHTNEHLHLSGLSVEVVCQECPASTVSPAGSTTIDACVCEANSYLQPKILDKDSNSFSATTFQFSQADPSFPYGHLAAPQMAVENGLRIPTLQEAQNFLSDTSNCHPTNTNGMTTSVQLPVIDTSRASGYNYLQSACGHSAYNTVQQYDADVIVKMDGSGAWGNSGWNYKVYLFIVDVASEISYFCQACPSGMTSPAGSTSSDACVCAANTYAKPGGAVVEFNPADESFDGTNTGYDLGTTALNIATAGFTVVTRVKFAAFQHWSSIFDFSDSNGDTANNNIRVNNVASAGKWSFDIREGGTVACQIYNQGTIELNTWYNIIARYKPGEGISLRANDAVFSTTCTTISDRVSTRTYIGQSFHSSLANFKGEIAGLYAHDRFLTNKEAEAVLSTITNTLTLHTDTGSHSWTEAQTFAASQGGRLPTLDELRAYETKTGYFAARNINEWIPVTNPGAPSGADYMMAYNGHGFSIGDSRWDKVQSEGDPISSSFGQQEWTGVGQYPVWFSSDLACVPCPPTTTSLPGSTLISDCACADNQQTVAFKNDKLQAWYKLESDGLDSGPHAAHLQTRLSATANFVSGQYLSVSDDVSFLVPREKTGLIIPAGTTALTVSFWVKNWIDGYVMRWVPSNLFFWENSDASKDGEASIEGSTLKTLFTKSSEWTHMLFVFDQTQIVFYENGVFKDHSTTAKIPAGGFVQETDKDAGLFCNPYSASNAHDFRGDIKDIRFYLSAFTSAEAQNLYAGVGSCVQCPTDGTVVEGCEPPCVDGTSFSYWSIRKSVCP